jgi:hypothetical protein
MISGTQGTSRFGAQPSTDQYCGPRFICSRLQGPRCDVTKTSASSVKGQDMQTAICIIAVCGRARSNTGIVGSNPTRGMDVCARLFCV